MLPLNCTERRLGLLHRHPRSLDADEWFHVRQCVRGLDALRAAGYLPETLLSERRGLLAQQHVFQSRRGESRHRATVNAVMTLGANYKKILRLSYDVIITYDYHKLLSHRKIILRFFCN